MLLLTLLSILAIVQKLYTTLQFKKKEENSGDNVHIN